MTRKCLWSNGHSHQVVPVRHKHDQPYSFECLEQQVRSSRAAKADMRRQRVGRPLIVANPRRDDSRKYVRQSDGYVMSGWRKG